MKSDIELKLIETVDTYCPDYPYSGLVGPMTHLDIIEKTFKSYDTEYVKRLEETIEELEEEMLEALE